MAQDPRFEKLQRFRQLFAEIAQVKYVIGDFITSEQYMNQQNTLGNDSKYLRALDNIQFPREIKELYRLELFPRLYRLQLFRLLRFLGRLMICSTVE